MLTIEALAAARVPVPPLPEQKKIAAILSSVDEAIQATQAVIDQTRRVKEGLLQDLLTRGLPGHHTRFKQTEIGEIPEGWEVRPLRTLVVAKPEYGANVPKSAFDPRWPRYIRITDVRDDGTLSEEAVSISPENATSYLLEHGDILLARSGATVGKSFRYLESHGPCAFAGYLIRFRFRQDIVESAYVAMCLRSKAFWRWVRLIARAGAQPNINAEEYGGFKIAVPALHEQRQMVLRVESIDAVSERALRQVVALQQVKSGLLQDLLTGKVRVSV